MQNEPHNGCKRRWAAVTAEGCFSRCRLRSRPSGGGMGKWDIHGLRDATLMGLPFFAGPCWLCLCVLGSFSPAGFCEGILLAPIISIPPLGVWASTSVLLSRPAGAWLSHLPLSIPVPPHVASVTRTLSPNRFHQRATPLFPIQGLGAVSTNSKMWRSLCNFFLVTSLCNHPRAETPGRARSAKSLASLRRSRLARLARIPNPSRGRPARQRRGNITGVPARASHAGQWEFWLPTRTGGPGIPQSIQRRNGPSQDRARRAILA